MFQKKEIPSQQQSNFTSSYDKHGGINSCSSNNKKNIFLTKIPKCALSYQVPLLMVPVQEKAPKVPKLNQEQQKQVDLEVKAMPKKGSTSKVCHSKGEFLSSSDQQKRRRQPTSHISERSESVHSLQTLQDGRFALSEVCVVKRGLHVENRPEGCILQCSSTQRFTKISTVFLGRELVRVPVPLLWFRISSHNIHKIIKGSNLSFETSYDKCHNYLDDLLILENSMSEIFMVKNSMIFLLQHLGVVVNQCVCVC